MFDCFNCCGFGRRRYIRNRVQGEQPDQSVFALQRFGAQAYQFRSPNITQQTSVSIPTLEPSHTHSITIQHSASSSQLSIHQLEQEPIRPALVRKKFSVQEIFQYNFIVASSFQHPKINPEFESEKLGYYIYFYCRRGATSDRQEGWKLHIAVDDNLTIEGKSNLAEAWDRINGILMLHHIRYSKVIFQKNPQSPEVSEILAGTKDRGKQIVIYKPYFDDFSKNDLINWQRLVTDIEQALKAQPMVAPDLRNESDKPIPGSLYISYRNDYNPSDGLSDDKRYLDGAEAIAEAKKRGDEKKAYNPFNSFDPFESIRV